ncbi:MULTISPECIES: DUF6510 family protein [unclassified Amycolatopsis]|uniref:DUF6510 family protein n=1 Tax=unclassified Amycolatopsis TaxID=2618356 RepID=UPI001C6A8AC5|nr:DUF6510 family protein [Amycolatopsis sp. DSM 110486]QYN19362.1 hypothetical protein K1T34_43210 [Amycolatopsis sp. DSM 110486]
MTMFDGNAIAGTLNAVFGGEMTTASGTCASCGATEVLAQLRVYRDAPGVVARCGHCDAILMVIVEKRGINCVDVSGFAALEEPTQL